ncbi:succinate dehydrogenase [Gardnerella vaginalis]|uniref:succinate dehydrogenase n=1 Tax=Gardnerella vaginalis TaxID=2702 RepID=A0ABD4Z9G8_GARVA|nr:2Fe-2S iron-sulfur cluster-binding protein [Gardnerella vaginalis]EGL13717.1 succinate dehydrogenase and fumarate reductase iron-sulfur protein [Gardnerella vaginalis 315-A]KMT47058.1 succinate dehydrogenase [Gardnerella vaginalis]MDK6695402.1 2Fe-2S iron-sulfur cluster-binding protein [Gardnerella vaginalis]MDK8328273.1 2Fe-2S iron-sulfur cluster-binding protein [Gardnerella vaginalis]NSX24093.1 4Fe-4S dicluster domain-containing protein [Gardnerella vaginalis]
MVDDFRRNFAHSNNQDCTTSDEAFVTFRVSRFTPNDDSRDSSVTCDSAVAGNSAVACDSATNSAPISSTNSPGLVRRHRESPFAKKRKSSPFPTQNSGDLPAKPLSGKHWIQDYTIRVRKNDTILDCLLKIKRTIDPTLAFRYSCGHGVCGSDAANVNGMPTLLCTATIAQNARQNTQTQGVRSSGFRKTGSVKSQATATPTTTSSVDENHNPQVKSQEISSLIQNGSFGIIEIAPLSGFAIQRDLICDLSPMIAQLKRLEPYLQTQNVQTRNSSGKLAIIEFLQHPEQLAKFELLSNCIMCGVCEGICPVYAGGEAFIGPAALINAARFINDSRDNATNRRLDLADSSDGISACQSVRACSRQCPRGIDVGEEIWQLTTLINERKMKEN